MERAFWMNEKKLVELPKLFIDLEDKSSDNVISQEVNKLFNSGHFLVNLEFKESAESKINNCHLDTDLFRKIKKIQELPDWVVIQFLLVAGKLKDSNFHTRISNG